VADRIGVSAPAILNWVNKFGQNAKSPIEIAQQLHPQWSGILGVDGKAVKISGTEAVVLVAVDMGTNDPFFFHLAEAENEEEAKKFFLIIKEVFHYPVTAVVSDLGKGRVFVNLVEQVFPEVPHQACVIHFSRYVDMKLPKSKKSKYYQQNEFLRRSIKDILFATDFNDADELLIRLSHMEHVFQANYQKAIIRSLRRNFKLLTAHFFHQDLPRDTNIVENIIKNLDRKLFQMSGFKNPQNAYHFLKLWFCAYRFRPFTSSNYAHRNGHSPLSLARVKTSKIDWLKFSQRKKQQQLT
jgi:transposase-like protein